MSEPAHDVVIIGGGPGGSAAATFLARGGKRVLVLEKENFPRFHIGESLLPYNRILFEEMGVLPKLEAAGFLQKHGAQFHLGNASTVLKLVFRNGAYTREARAFQVERAKFDHLLLQHAEESGAEVRQGWTVSHVETTPSEVVVEAQGPEGVRNRFRGSYLIDCSGRANVTGNQEGVRVHHHGFRKVAVFSHFSDVQVDEGTPAGDTVIVRLKDRWFWMIPVGTDKVSVGLVLDQDAFVHNGGSPADVFDEAVQSSPVMRERMARARPLKPIQITTDFSYYNRTLVGPRMLRVGDAAGFMDPIFSAGVYLAMHSGRLAARTVTECLKGNGNASALLADYEKRLFGVLRYYWRLSKGFYDPAFLDLFMQPRGRLGVRDAMVAILAGEVDGGWRIAWRRQLFLLLVWIQSRFPLVPRLSFEPRPTEPTQGTGVEAVQPS